MRVGISGHRDLAPATARAVRSEIKDFLTDRADGLIGVSCLANGADQIFAQAVIRVGGTLTAIVPAAEYRDRLPEDAHALYDALMEDAAEVIRLDFQESSSEAHMAASIAMLDRIDTLVAVWDGLPARGYGGTADVIEEARARRIEVVRIWPDGARRGS